MSLQNILKENNHNLKCMSIDVEGDLKVNAISTSEFVANRLYGREDPPNEETIYEIIDFTGGDAVPIQFYKGVIPIDDNTLNLGEPDLRWSRVCTSQIQFSQNQSVLSVYYDLKNEPLAVGGAIANINTTYSGVRIGNYVCLTIANFNQQPCTSNTLPLTFSTLNQVFRPASGQSVSVSLVVQTGSGTLTLAEAIINDTGVISLYSGLTNASFFTLTNQLRVGYSGSSYFNLCYNII